MPFSRTAFRAAGGASAGAGRVGGTGREGVQHVSEISLQCREPTQQHP